MFKPLKAEDYPLLKDHFDIHGWSLCEYSLSSIIAWNHCIYDVYYREGGLLISRSRSRNREAACCCR